MLKVAPTFVASRPWGGPARRSPASSAPTSDFSWPVRVYWEDTDAGGIVFYANYLKFFERSRTEWLRSLGIEQQRLRETTGGFFVVIETSIRYHRPARLDDELVVTAKLVETGRASLIIGQQALLISEQSQSRDSPVREGWSLGACRTWGGESENRPQRGQLLPDLQAHSPAMGQGDGEKWTAAVDLQPTLPKSDRLLGSAVMSVVTYAELRAGLEIQSANRAQDERVLALLISRIPVLPFSETDAASFGVLAAAVRDRRRDTMDRLIAAHAVSVGVTLVTNHEADFKDYPGLNVENWALSA